MQRAMVGARSAYTGLLLVVFSAAGATGAAQVSTTPPAPGPITPAKFPPFQEATLANGVHLVVVESHKQPVLSVELSVPAGEIYDPAGKEGLSDMVAGLLTKGAGKRSAEEIAEAIEGVGGSVVAGSSEDFLTVRADALSANAALAFELVGDAVVRPTFPAKELDLLRTQTLSGLQLELADPASIAARAFARAVYGTGPYAKRPTPATVGAITHDDLVAFQTAHLSPAGALVVVAGDISLAQAKALATTAFAGWTGPPPVAMTMPALPAHTKTEILLIHRPGSVQSNVLVGGPTFLPTDPRAFPLRIANRILGGGPESRLFMIVREQKSYAYDAHTETARPKWIGSFRAVTETRTDATDSALTEVLKQFDRVRTEPLPATELEDAKNALVGQFPLTIETADQVAQAVAAAKQLDLPANYLQTYRNKLAAVTGVEVQSVAKSVIVPHVIVVVGDATKLYDRLQKIAPVTLLNPDGSALAASELVAKAAPIKVDASKLQPAKDSFTVVLMQGAQEQSIGFEVTTLTHEGENYHLKDATGIPMAGVQQTADVIFNATTLAPVSIKASGTANGQTAATDIAFANGRAKGSAQAPGPAGIITTAIDTTIAPGVIDNNTLTVLLPLLDLAEGYKNSFPLFDTNTGTTATENLRVTGKETTTVPAGTFEVYRVEGQGKQSVTLLVTTAAPHRIVKIMPAGAPIELRLAK